MSGRNYLNRLLDRVAVEWKALGEVADIYGGLTGKVKADFDGGNAKYITYKNIYSNASVDLDSLGMVQVADSESQNAIAYGDVLFTASSETADEVGMSSSITTPLIGPVYLNSFSFGVRFFEGIPLDPEFSKHLFRSSFMRTQIAKTASGVTRFNVSKDRFRKLQIPIPCPNNPQRSLDIQAEIVRILDTFAELTAKLTAELTAELAAHRKQYDHYRAQVLQFDDNKVEWTVLGDENRFEIANTARRPVKASLRTAGKNPYYGANNVQDYVDGHTHDGEYVLIAEDGSASLENYSIQYASGKFWANNHVHVVRGIHGLNTRFLYHYLRIVDFIPFLPNRERAKLTKAEMVKIPVPIPHPQDPEESLKVQGKIVRILDKFDALTNSLSEDLPREIALRQNQYAYYRDLLLSFPKSEELAR